MTAFLPLAKAEWGTVPDWLVAFGTLAAFAVALRLLAKELAARRDQEEDRRRDQARLVAAWLVRNPVQESGGEYTIGIRVGDLVPPDPKEFMHDLYVIVRNGSTEPVYDVRATVVHKDSQLVSDPNAARGQFFIPYAGVDWDVVPPSEVYSQELGIFSKELRKGIFPSPYVALGLSFNDSQGRRWKRLPDGTLSEVTKRPRRSRKDFYNAWIAGELDHLDY